MKKNKIYLIAFFMMLTLINCGQDETETINEMLNGRWNWIRCIPSQFECQEQPSDSLKRSIVFTKLGNDNLSYTFITYNNDSIIKTDKIILEQESTDSWKVYKDIVFGMNSIIIYHGDKYYILNKINDTTIWIRLGNSKSSLVYEYKKNSYN